MFGVKNSTAQSSNSCCHQSLLINAYNQVHMLAKTDGLYMRSLWRVSALCCDLWQSIITNCDQPNREVVSIVFEKQPNFILGASADGT